MVRGVPSTASTEEARAGVDGNQLWYHTLELAPGVVTPGWFDLRPIVDRMPWPDVRGKRCLDIGTYDGYLAFELERRGAAEVVATDVEHHEGWDWPARERAQGPEVLAAIAGEKGRGFEVAKELLGSKVERVFASIYELDPEQHGTFDVVVCGSLLLHLRDPIRALEAVRSVCSGVFLSADQIDVRLTLLNRRRPVFRLSGDNVQWWLPNTVAHRRMVQLAGFKVERTARPYAVPLGTGHPSADRPLPARRRLARQLLCGGTGVPTHARLARPAV